MMRSMRPLLAALLLVAALASPARADFVLNNLRFTLLHEAAHAVIDQWSLGLTGPEEIAADGLALMLAQRMMDPEALGALVEDVVALGRLDALGELHDPWEPYLPGAHRVAWTICVYHGLAPALHGDRARALGMPAPRGRRCAMDVVRMRAAWEPVLAKIRNRDGRTSFEAGRRGKALFLLKEDLLRLNREVTLPQPIPVLSERCGEDNAFYFHFDARIVFCDEMVEALRALRR